MGLHKKKIATIKTFRLLSGLICWVGLKRKSLPSIEEDSDLFKDVPSNIPSKMEQIIAAKSLNYKESDLNYEFFLFFLRSKPYEYIEASLFEHLLEFIYDIFTKIFKGQDIASRRCILQLWNSLTDGCSVEHLVSIVREEFPEKSFKNRKETVHLLLEWALDFYACASKRVVESGSMSHVEISEEKDNGDFTNGNVDDDDDTLISDVKNDYLLPIGCFSAIYGSNDCQYAFELSRLCVTWSVDLDNGLHTVLPKSKLSTFFNPEQKFTWVPVEDSHVDGNFGVVHSNHPYLKPHVKKVNKMNLCALAKCIYKKKAVSKSTEHSADPMNYTRDTAMREDFGASTQDYKWRMGSRPKNQYMRDPPNITFPIYLKQDKEAFECLGSLSDILSDVVGRQFSLSELQDDFQYENFTEPLNQLMEVEDNLFPAYSLILEKASLWSKKGGKFHFDKGNGKESHNNKSATISVVFPWKPDDEHEEEDYRIGLVGFCRNSISCFAKNETGCTKIKELFQSRMKTIEEEYSKLDDSITLNDNLLQERNRERIFLNAFDHIPPKEAASKFRLFTSTCVGEIKFTELPYSYCPEISMARTVHLLKKFHEAERNAPKRKSYMKHILLLVLCFGDNMELVTSGHALLSNTRTARFGDRAPRYYFDEIIKNMACMQDNDKEIKKFNEHRSEIRTCICWKSFFFNENNNLQEAVKALDTFHNNLNQSDNLTVEKFYEYVLTLCLALPGIHPYYVQDAALYLALIGRLKYPSNAFLRLPIQDPIEKNKEIMKRLEKLSTDKRRVEEQKILKKYSDGILSALEDLRKPALMPLKIEGIWNEIIMMLGLNVTMHNLKKSYRLISIYLGLGGKKYLRPYWLERMYRSSKNTTMTDIVYEGTPIYWIFEDDNDGHVVKIKENYGNSKFETNDSLKYSDEDNYWKTRSCGKRLKPQVKIKRPNMRGRKDT